MPVRQGGSGLGGQFSGIIKWVERPQTPPDTKQLSQQLLLSRLWNPVELGSTVAAWHRGDLLDPAGFPTSILGWEDKTGNGNDGTRSGVDPDVIQSDLNNLNTLQFTGASGDFLIGLSSSFGSGFSEASIFFVAKVPSETGGVGNGAPYSRVGTAGGNVYPDTGGSIADDFFSTTTHTVGDPGAVSAWHIASFRSKTGDWRYAFNGADFFTTATNTFAAGSGSAPLFGVVAGPRYWTGTLAEIIVCNSFLTEQQRALIEGYLAWKWGLQGQLAIGHTWATEPPQPGAAQSAASYSLTAALGTFTYSGQSAGLVRGLVMPAANGVFSYNGQSAGLFAGGILAAANATFTYSGQAATLTRGLLLAAVNATFAYSGQAANLTRALDFAAAGGTFAYSGQAANFALGYALAAGLGTFTYSGQDAAFPRALTLAAGAGVFSYTGQAAALAVGLGLAADPGVYSYNGQAAALTPSGTLSSALTASLGTFSYSGQDAGLQVLFVVASALAAEVGAFNYYGQPVALTLVKNPFLNDTAPTVAGLSVPPLAPVAATAAAVPPVSPAGWELAAAVSPPQAFSDAAAPDAVELEA